jgi:hypothetical protein
MPALRDSVPTRLAEATVRGATRVGSGRAALAGIVSAEAVALMKGVSQTMTTTKRIAMAAAALTAGLVTTGVGLLADPGRPPASGSPSRRRRPEPSASIPLRRPFPGDASHLDEHVLLARAGSFRGLEAMVGGIQGVERRELAELLTDRFQEIHVGPCALRSDDTDARREARRCVGRSDRRAPPERNSSAAAAAP